MTNETYTGPRTIHVLRYGRTLCGFGLGLFPCDWPKGNYWMRADDAKGATCAGCLAEARKLGLR